MKIVLTPLVVLVCFWSPTSAQLVDKEPQELCQTSAFAKSKSVDYWAQQLREGSPGGQYCAADALATLGTEATTAVPALTTSLYAKDGMLRNRAMAALVKIADGSDTSSAAQALIKIIAQGGNPYVGPRELALRGLTQIYKNRGLVGTWTLSGWPGLYPGGRLGPYSFYPPTVSSDGKSYSQRVVSAHGGALGSWTTEETLIRDASLVKQYSDDAISGEKNKPTVGVLGKRKALTWNLNRDKGSGLGHCRSGRFKTVVLLGPDKAWISETCSNYPFDRLQKLPEGAEIVDFRSAFFDRAEAALDNPPRTNFRRTVALFQQVKKGMTNVDVSDFAGEPDKMLRTGYDTAVALYELLDGSTIVLSYRSPSQAGKTFWEGGLWTLEYGNHTETKAADGTVRISEFVK